MELLKIALRTKKEDPQRQIRLKKIQRAIEASIKYEEEAMSKPLNASTLKRIYNLDSLWIVMGDEIKKLGSASYQRELDMFLAVKEKYGVMDSVKIDRKGRKYHIVERGGKIYLFSTSLELTNSDISMILREIEESLDKKKIFLSSETNISVE